MKPKVTVIGLGFVGLSLASFLGAKNIPVIGIDSDGKKIQKIGEGKPHFYEPDLQFYLKKALRSNLHLETKITEDGISDFIFITVGTPVNEHNKINLDYVKSVVTSLTDLISNSQIVPSIIIKSTIVPGTTEKVIRPILERKSLRESVDFHLLTNPEFLREGSAMQDTISPHLIVIGGSNKKGIQKLRKFYEPVYPKSQPFIETNNSTAEMIKYANNAFLATKISFINSMANICQKIEGTNIDDVAQAIGMDPRIGNLFLKAGPGYGGSCFPKDVQALISFSNEIGYTPILLNAVRDTNTLQVSTIIDIIKQNLHSLDGKKIGILGLAFKENTDDIRESVSIKLIDYLLKHNCKILVHDPKAIENTFKIYGNKITYCKDVNDIFDDLDCVILLTPWREYEKINEDKIIKMKNPLVIDTRRILKINNKKINYVGIGIGK